MVIAQEAGGFVTGSKDTPHDGVITEAILTGRRYLVIRGVAETSVRNISFLFDARVSHLYACPHAAIPTEQEESSLDVQKRLAREFYDTVQDIPLDE
jgi:myo-inositol-1(or 4)-monophosphatase